MEIQIKPLAIGGNCQEYRQIKKKKKNTMKDKIQEKIESTRNDKIQDKIKYARDNNIQIKPLAVGGKLPRLQARTDTMQWLTR